MDIQISADLLKALEQVVEQQHSSLEEVIKTAIENYVATHEKNAKFEADVDRIMAEHRWLLDELAKR